MTINTYETHGRRLMVEFTCRRCRTRVVRPLEECMREQTECYRELYDLKPPADWEDGGFYYPLFCPECAKAYELFMNGKEVPDARSTE